MGALEKTVSKLRLRMKRMTAALHIQACWRRAFDMHKYVLIQRAVARLQAMARTRFACRTHAAVRLQSLVRGSKARCMATELRTARMCSIQHGKHKHNSMCLVLAAVRAICSP